MADAIRRARQKREKTADAPSSTQTIGIEMQANPIAVHDTAEAMGEESTAGPLLPAGGSEGSESQNDEDTLHTSGKKPGLMQITAKWSNDTNLFVSTDYFTGGALSHFWLLHVFLYLLTSSFLRTPAPTAVMHPTRLISWLSDCDILLRQEGSGGCEDPAGGGKRCQFL